MGNTKSAEKKGIGALNWTLLLVIGFSAQIAWVIENNWFANFLYSDFGAQLGVVTAMTICSATATTFSALFFGTLSDRIGSRKKLITWGSILWGIFTIAFGLTHYLRDSIYNDVMLVGVTIVAADTIMSFFGSMANDAGYNAWYADMMDDSNSGQIGAVAATLPVIGTLVGTLVGGMFVTGLATEANPQAGYIIFFSVAGGVTVLVGIASFFLLKDAPTLKPVKDGGFWHQFGSTFNFRRFAANRELALVFLTLCIFFIGYNCYFIHSRCDVNTVYKDHKQQKGSGRRRIRDDTQHPRLPVCLLRRRQYAELLRHGKRPELCRQLAVLCRHNPCRHRLRCFHAGNDGVDEAPVPRGAPRSV